MAKDEILNALTKKRTKQVRKSYPLRVEVDVFTEIEKINESSGIDNINEVLTLLIKLGLEEYNRSKA